MPRYARPSCTLSRWDQGVRIARGRSPLASRPAPAPGCPGTASLSFTPTPTSDVAISGVDFKLGVATWYSYVPGDCATWYLPKGTRITVLDLGTGRSITCIITDRESHMSNHVVDLDETQFAELEPLSKGVISVKVSW